MLDAVERSTGTLEKLDFEVLSLRAEALEKERDMEKCPGSQNFLLVLFKLCSLPYTSSMPALDTFKHH